MIEKLRRLVEGIRFELIRYFRTREVTKVLRNAHKLELARTPVNEWPLITQRHTREISNVKAGNFDIVDRKSIAYPLLPSAVTRLEQPILKPEPYTLKRFAETPVPRRAINLIKNSVLKLQWKISPLPDEKLTPEMEKRIQILTNTLRKPNNSDTWRSLMEPVLEDIIVGGYGAIEPQLTPYYKRPFKLWAVDGSSIMIYPVWYESNPDMPKYAQRTVVGMQELVNFRHDELIYIRDNIRSFTPFGIGKLEVAFRTVSAFLGIQEQSSQVGEEPIRKTWLWWNKPQSNNHIQNVVRHIETGGEGRSAYSFMSGFEAPQVITATARMEADLMLGWQEFLIRIVAMGFDLSPLSMGIEKDVNRNTGEILSQQDFNSAVQPMAVRVEEHVTNDIIHDLLGWRDLQFEYVGLDDPDMLTKLNIMLKQDTLDALVPDEVRAELGKKELAGGFGKLTKTQRQILVQDSAAKLAAANPAAAKAAGSVKPETPDPGSNAGAGGTSSFGGGGGMRGASDPMPGSAFSPNDVAQMHPDHIQKLQQMKLLPDTNTLATNMKAQDKSIFETLSEELLDFFQYAEEHEEEMQVHPQDVSDADEKGQQKKYKSDQKRQKEEHEKDMTRGILIPRL